jgi:hypothetical protein
MSQVSSGQEVRPYKVTVYYDNIGTASSLVLARRGAASVIAVHLSFAVPRAVNAEFGRNVLPVPILAGVAEYIQPPSIPRQRMGVNIDAVVALPLPELVSAQVQYRFLVLLANHLNSYLREQAGPLASARLGAVRLSLHTCGLMAVGFLPHSRRVVDWTGVLGRLAPSELPNT